MGRTNDDQIKSQKIYKLTLGQRKKMLNFINFLYPNLQQIYILMINHGVIILIGKLNLKNMSIKNKKNNIKMDRNYTNYIKFS